MRKKIFLSALFLPFTFAHAGVVLESIEQRISYTVGQQIGQQLRMEKVPVDQEALFRGIRDFIEANEPLIDRSAQQQTVIEFQEYKSQLVEEARRKNLLQGQAYMKANSTKQGVKATRSGLQYSIITEGSGPRASIEDRVKVHYEGRLLDGTIFDSSYEREEPLEMLIKQTILGWQEALTMMPIGSKWQLTIPSHLAYGEQGVGSKIPSNATLIFEIELFEILPLEAENRRSGGHRRINAH